MRLKDLYATEGFVLDSRICINSEDSYNSRICTQTQGFVLLKDLVPDSRIWYSDEGFVLRLKDLYSDSRICTHTQGFVSDSRICTQTQGFVSDSRICTRLKDLYEMQGFVSTQGFVLRLKDLY